MDQSQVYLLEAEELLSETQRLRERNDAKLAALSHKPNRAQRRQAVKNQRRKSR